MYHFFIIYNLRLGSLCVPLTLFNHFIHRQHFTTVDNSSLEDKVQTIEQIVTGNSVGLIW